MRDVCPTTDALEAILLGRTEDAGIERHVAGCPDCAARLAAVGGGDEFTAALRAASPALACVADPAVGELIERLRDLPASVDTPPPAATLVEIPAFDPAAADGELGRVGPYRLRRVLGRGGTGVVYLAWHEPLKREVALKLLAANPEAGDRLRRFRREAELVARLRHANVVPVYEVGEWSGRPYFAMEYVAGGTLAERLAERPLPTRAAAELVATLADAVQAAHEAGVVHRDLKPANVLLEPQISNLKSPIPKIADFGLAKALDASGATFDTRSGAVLGTPGYLAPEQLGGDALAPAADVYSLGAILYECLTGRPPFKAASLLETLDQARTQDPLPPGRLQPGLPRDLQTICLKCLERDPRRRYATAAALADDLRRFLDGRPILARPAAWWERAGKWMKRRPAAAALVAATVAFLAVLAGGALAYQTRLRQEVKRAEHGEAQALRQGQRADAQYREARQAMQNMLDRVRQRAASGIPQVKELERAQLEHALTFYLRAAEQSGDDAEVRADAALAALEAGKLQKDLGRPGDAAVNFRRARDTFAALAEKSPTRPEYRSRLAASWAALATALTDPGESTAASREGLALYEELGRDDPASADYLAGRATCHHNLGTASYTVGRKDEAVEQFALAERLRGELVRRAPGDAEQAKSLAKTQLNLSVTYQGLGLQADAKVYRDRAEATLTEILRLAPNDASAASSLAILRVNWAYVQQTSKLYQEALNDVAKNLVMLEPLIAKEPNAVVLRDALHATHGVRAEVLGSAGRYPEAVAAWRQVVATAPPDQAVFRRLFLASALAQAGDHAAAFAEVEAVADRPECRDWQRQYHLSRVCCRAAVVAGAPADRVECYLRRAVALLGNAKAALEATSASSQNAAGWGGVVPGLLSDDAFRPLIGRDDFRKIVGPR